MESGKPTAENARELRKNTGTFGNRVNSHRREHPASEELSLPDVPGFGNSSARTVTCVCRRSS